MKPGIACRRRWRRAVDARDRAEQPLGVGLKRIGEQVAGRRLLHHARCIEDRDVVSVLGDDAEVVRDQNHREAEALLQFANEIENLRLNRDVERGGRLVGDQHAGSHASAIAIITRWRIPPDS